jgi:hypothetical protein
MAAVHAVPDRGIGDCAGGRGPRDAGACRVTGSGEGDGDEISGLVRSDDERIG